MRVLQVISSLDPGIGGPARSVAGLCRGLAALGVETLLYVYSSQHDLVDPGAVRFIKGRGEGVRQVKQDIIEIIEEYKPDLIHIHALWSLQNHMVAKVARRKGVPYIIAPRGMLEPWSLNAKKWKKRLALWLYQRRDLKRAFALHATAESEAEQLRRLGFKQQIIISPNGVDVPECMPERRRRSDGKRTVLFVSRIHPKKGLIELVESWSALRGSADPKCLNALVPECLNVKEGVGPPLTTYNLPLTEQELKAAATNWHVEYAGPDSGGHLAEVQARIRERGLEADFTYLGELDDENKWEAYRRADLFVLPTYSENFGIVVAEALAAGVPVITTKGAPWAELEGTCQREIADEFGLEPNNRCGWWIDIGVEPLANALREAMGLSDEARCVMGENGRVLVQQKYSWPAISKQMKTAYEWILNGSEKPGNLCGNEFDSCGGRE